MDKTKYVCNAWYNETDAYFDFGPFTAEEADAFRKAHPERDWFTFVLNPPELYGTGQELC